MIECQCNRFYIIMLDFYGQVLFTGLPRFQSRSVQNSIIIFMKNNIENNYSSSYVSSSEAPR